MRKNTRKGFSLLEALVSLTVVVIVSIATVSLYSVLFQALIL